MTSAPSSDASEYAKRQVMNVGTVTMQAMIYVATRDPIQLISNFIEQSRS